MILAFRTGEKVQQVKVLAAKPDAEFNPQTHHGGRGELTPASCPLTSTHML